MKKWLSFALASLFVSCAFAQTPSNIQPLLPYRGEDPSPLSGCYNGSACELNYHGGPVFEDAPTIYIVYYGSFTAKDKSIINTYFENLSGSQQEKINTRFSDSTGKYYPGTIKFDPAKDTYHDNYSEGKTLSDIQPVIAAAIKDKHLPNDTNGIYIGLTYQDVDYNGMCTEYCGYHGPSTTIVKGETIKYAFVGDPGRCPDSCSYEYLYGSKASPNDDIHADGSINIMWHESSESISDPEVNLDSAWYSEVGYESMDLCAWLALNYKVDKNGNYYTILNKGHEYLTQMGFELDTKTRKGNVSGTCENVYKNIH
jgi:hypothetical protein